MTDGKEKKIFNIRDIPNKLLLQFIIYVLTSLGALLLSLLVSVKISNLFILSSLEKWLLISSTSLITIGIAFYFFKRRYRKFVPQFEPAQSNFHVLEKEFTHEYLEPEKIRHKRRWVLKALRDGLESFNDKFFWTGGKWEWRTTIEDHRVFITGNRNLYDLYIYQFDRVLKKGDTIEIEVEWTLFGPHKFFFSTPIEEPTDKLIMGIKFPIEWKIQKVICDESGIQGAKLPNSQKEVDLSRGTYTWTPSNVKLFHHYEIKWNLNNHK